MRRLFGFLFLVGMRLLPAYSADVLFLQKSDAISPEQRQVEIAAEFYGLGVKKLAVGRNDDTALFDALHSADNVAIIIRPDALPGLNLPKFRQSLLRRTNSVPVLILGIDSDTDSAALGLWSGAAVGGVACTTEHGASLHYRFEARPQFARQLAGRSLSFASQRICAFEPERPAQATVLARVEEPSRSLPVFLAIEHGARRLFLASAVAPGKQPEFTADPDEIAKAFTPLAPAFVFLRYAAGERGWHSADHYANLTMDDPWLRKTYGRLDYAGLVREMQQHNFHTTIAFVPWNYDRSDPSTAALFRAHPDRLSLCIHGNNHDHKEFTSYREKSYDEQAAGLRQAIARMRRFEDLTGIPYDRIMVFPHSIGPERTLGELKRQNYRATINSTNVPMGASAVSDPAALLRPMTLAYENFPSITRYSVEAPLNLDFVALNAFLDNPLLLYGHHPMFASGIDAFDGLADNANRIDSTLKWRSLGEIVRHLYLIRSREDSEYDVHAYASDLELGNSSARPTVFHLEKPEDGNLEIESVLLDSHPVAFQLKNGNLYSTVPMAARAAHRFTIRYRDDSEHTQIDPHKASSRVTLLRWASDLRDNYLWRFGGGIGLVHLYYGQPIHSMPRLLLFLVAISATVCLFLLLYCLLRRARMLLRPPMKAAKRSS